MSDQKIKIHTDPDSENTFRLEEKRHRKFKKRNKAVVYLAIALVFVYLMSLWGVVAYNASNYSLAWFITYAGENLKDLYNLILGNDISGSGIAGTVLQLAVAVLAGAALSACGTVFQGTFRNRVAAPSVLGVMAAGQLGYTVWVLVFYGYSNSYASNAYVNSEGIRKRVVPFLEALNINSMSASYLKEAFVLAACFLGVFLVVGITVMAGRGRILGPELLLAGMLCNTYFGTVPEFVMYVLMDRDPMDHRVDMIEGFSMGYFGIHPGKFLGLALSVIVCITIMLLLTKKLNIFALGDEEAQAMGINVKVFKYLTMALGTIMTAVILAACGSIGFVGLIIPNLARKLAGSDLRRLLPASMLLGGIFLMVVFDFAACFLRVTDINLMTSIIGTPVLIIIFISQRRKRNAEFA